MTRPSDDDAIWMLSDNSETKTSRNTYQNYMSPTKKVVRSSFITNLRCEHSTHNGTKCWCSKCAKDRLKYNFRTDLLFLSSDLLSDFLRPYEIVHWKSERLANIVLPSFQTIHPNICENLDSELIKSAQEFRMSLPSPCIASHVATATTVDKARQLTSSSQNVLNVKSSTNVPKSMAGHAILRNLESSGSRRHSISENRTDNNLTTGVSNSGNSFSTRSISMIDNVPSNHETNINTNSSTRTNNKSIKVTESNNILKPSMSNNAASSRIISDVLENTCSGETEVQRYTCPVQRPRSPNLKRTAICALEIPSPNGEKPRFQFKIRRVNKCLPNDKGSGLKMKFSLAPSSLSNSAEMSKNIQEPVLRNVSVPTKVSTKIRARYERDLSRQKKKQRQKIKLCEFPKSSHDTLKSAYNKWETKLREDDDKIEKEQVLDKHQDITETNVNYTEDSEDIVQKTSIQYPIPVLKKPLIPSNLLRAKNNIIIFVGDMCRTYECFGSFVELSPEQKLRVFENNGIDLNKHLSVTITKNLRKQANKHLLKLNRNKGIITPWKISKGVPINEPSSMQTERRHSSDSDSGVDVSIEGLIVGIKPPPTVKEPITCNLCSDSEVYQSDEQLWLHQKSMHLGKDCTKENVFPVRIKRIVDYSTCEPNVGPNMCKFDQEEKAEQQKENYNPVWVCFECNPPTILKEDKFNSHAEDLLHFENVVHFKNNVDAVAEIKRKIMAS